MYYQKITKFDTANGPGIRSVLWVSGCEHHCKGCHNPDTHNPTSGNLFTSDTWIELIESIMPDYIAGITFSGGDPLYISNRDTVTDIAHTIKSQYPNKSVWLYTGYLYEQVKDLPIMKYVDVLVDGKFILEQRDIRLRYKGSPNQRVIDIPKTRESGKIVLYDE